MNNLLLSGANPDIIKPALSNIIVGGVESFVTTIKAFLLAMMLYPEVQKKAQDELDVVLGTSSENEVLRLPTFDEWVEHKSLQPLIQYSINAIFYLPAIVKVSFIISTP